MSGPSKLPVVTIQPTFLEVIGEVRSGIVPSDTFWLSGYKPTEPSIHSKVRVTLDEVNRDVIHLEPSGGFEIKDVGRDVSLNLLTVGKDRPSSLPELCRFIQAWTRGHQDPHPSTPIRGPHPFKPTACWSSTLNLMGG